MKPATFFSVVLLVALGFSALLYQFLLPDFIRDGGPLVILLITLTMMVVTFAIERQLALRAAQGTGPVLPFIKRVQQAVRRGDIDDALAACEAQRGSLATVVAAALYAYQGLDESQLTDRAAVREEVHHAINEAMLLEVPLLEKNLIALSTIASVATLIGLLGTVVGMIRAFRALAHAGAPDAIQLSVGISEALVNTAGGLIAAISAVLAYNYFITRIDSLTYMIDEAGAGIVQVLVHTRPAGYTVDAGDGADAKHRA